MSRVYILAGLMLLLAGFLLGREWRDRSADLAESRQEIRQARAETNAIQAARMVEHNQAEKLAEIGAKHEEDRAAAPAVANAVVADLRAGNLRLRREWAGCEIKLLSQAAAGAVERDAAAQRREELAGAVVRVGAEADSQLAACQAVIKEYSGVL